MGINKTPTSYLLRSTTVSSCRFTNTAIPKPVNPILRRIINNDTIPKHCQSLPFVRDMAEKITDEQVKALQRVLHSDASVDVKVAHVTAVKTGIKHFEVPPTCVAELFEALRYASGRPQAVLAYAGLTSLNHLLTRVSRQIPKYMKNHPVEAKETLQLLGGKMGDQNQKFRALAVQSMSTMYTVVPDDTSEHVRVSVMGAKNSNAKAKESSMQWLLQMASEKNFLFSTFIPSLMKLIDDADPGVRTPAKQTFIDLYKLAANLVKADQVQADLKKQLDKVQPINKKALLEEIAPNEHVRAENVRAETVPATRQNLTASVSSLSSERPITPAPDVRTEVAEPSYLTSMRELEDMFRDMHGHFDGRESEHNWMLREQSITKLRRLMAGNAVSDFHDPFLAGLRNLLDGIIKAVTSLRTSLSKEGCALVQDIAVNYGPGMDPMVELLMQACVKLSGATKKIASLQGNACVDAIIGRVTYTHRIMQHVAGACADKNVQPRLYATAWLKTLLNKEAPHKSRVEHTGGLDLIEKSIKRGLNDPNPGVREKMRGTFWTFHGIWPARAEA